ncbi:MAG: ABC transporter substrate-binding protein [Myxococcota bacterium]
MSRGRFGGRALGWGCLFGVTLAFVACTNNPYPDSDDGVKVRYIALRGPPKTLDPAISYNAADHQILANVYESLLEYHFLKRPYELIPGLAENVPQARTLDDGRVSYRFRLRRGMRFQDDVCFERNGAGKRHREILASDVAFQIMRIADPEVISPVKATFAKIDGFDEFSKRLEALRESDPEFAGRRIDEQYEAAGGVDGLVLRGPYVLDVVLTKPYPQMIFWFAMHFTAPVPWEAVDYYDGEEGRPFFKEHPVSTGPFQLTRYDKHNRVVLERNPNWYGAQHPEWRAPGTIYPFDGEPGDEERGLLAKAYQGQPLPFLDRIEFRMEKEDIPAFNKFLQGYYDASGIIQESFDQAVQEGDLSPAMEARGMQLAKSVQPDIFYLGFNMSDPVVGAAAGDAGRKLRQAMSLVIDTREFTRVFVNGRGVPAQSPIPPGIFGYDPDYVNPYRQVDVERAKELLAEAGYPGGIDSETDRPLRLTFDVGDASTRGRLRFQFFVEAWRRLGIDVELAATNYNRFQEKVRDGAYQIFSWGWIADYPDSENFLFLLWGPNSSTANPGAPNSANFAHPRFDRLFVEMRDMPNGPERMAKIREMRAILERERPWIELYHREAYALFHGWLSNVKPAGISLPASKYMDLDPRSRAELRRGWNAPIRWPAWALGIGVVAVAVPGIITFFRERQ